MTPRVLFSLWAFVVEGVNDPVAYVVSLNVKRRNLSKGQTAIAAAEVLINFDHSQRSAATMFGVSQGYVSQARALLERDPPINEPYRRDQPPDRPPRQTS